MIKRFFILLLAIVASVGMSWAQAPGIVSSGTKGGMSYTFYDNGLLEISGSGALPGSAFTNWNDGFGASVKNIRFAEDCEVYGLDYMWFACYTQKSQLETIEINSVTPIMFSGSSGAGITYKQDGAVTITITAPGIVDIENKIIRNYGSPVNMIFNMPATTVFEKKWFSSLENYFAVTIPTGAKGHIPGGYSFTNPYDQQDYDHFVEMGHEADFWEYNGDRLTEGVDYTLGVESTFVITAENASQIFGQATVSFQAPTQASNSEWVLWRKSDLKTFSDMSSGDQKVCKDVTVKVNNGVYNTDSGFGIHFDSSDEDGVQFVAPDGKVFKRIVILNEYGTFSDPNWSYDGNYKKWSGSANTVGFEGDICGISLIEFELGDSAPAPTPTTTDLASITGDYTAQDGEILTGTLGVNVKISIADGATVTLLNANINGDKTWTTGEYAGLTCLGDATITIVGKNSVSGFYADELGNGYPGIYVPSGKTLIINGTGSLTAQSSTEEAAGIGARKNMSCGNIEIQSGKITAIANGEYGAGIGGAYNASCGDITISGGIVTAVGGDHCAGIGGGRRGASTNAGHCGNILISGGVVSATSGKQAAAIGGGRGNNNNYKTNCGTISITNTALKVYAEQGGDKGSTNTIGAAKYGNCGAVEIGGNTGVINDDPYTYRTKEDGEIVVVYINAIGTVVYTQECKDKIDIARELYDALEDSQIDLVTNYQVLLDAEAAYAALIPAAAPAYETVMNLINEIPDPVVLTAECKAKIDAARAAFIALSDGDKDLVTNIATLTNAEAAFDNVMDIWLSGDCDAILWKDTTLTVRKHAGEGNGAMADYNYMSRAPWYSAHWYDPKPNDIVIKSVTIEEGVTHLGDYAFAWMSEMKTATIPSSVTTIPEDAFYWSKAVDDIYLHTNPSDLMWMQPTSADVQFKPEKGTNAHVPVDLLPVYQELFKGLNLTYVGDQTPTVLTLEVGRIFNDSDEVYIGPDTTYIQFNCFNAGRYFLGKGTFKIIGTEYVAGEVFGIKFEPKSSYSFMKYYSNGNSFVSYGTNCCTTAIPTQMTVVSGDGTKDNPFLIEPNTKGECVQAEMTTLPQAVSEITYDGEPHTLVAAGVSTAGTVQYSIDNGASWSAELPQGINPVTYTIHYRVIGGNSCILGIDYDPNNKVTASIVAPAVENVKAKIAAIPQPVVYTPACEEAIAEARSAYDALDDNLKPYVENYDVLTAAEAAYANLKDIAVVEAKINNIPTQVELKLATRDSINNARAAYEALNADQKPLVSNYTKLTDAEDALAALNPGVPPATPLDSAQAVKDLIDAIPTPLEYPTSGAAIEAALNAFNELSDAAKGALDAADVQKLTDAATQYAALEAIAAIEAIPAEIVYDPLVKAAIETARDKYDALSVASKALVDDEVVAKLTKAEQAWANLVALIEHNVSYIGKDGELKNEKVALLHIPNPAPDFNGYEFVRWDVKAGDFLEEGLRVKAVYTPIITTNPQGFDTLAYNGLAQELVKAGVAKEGQIEYSLYPEESESWSAELPKATTAGVYAIYYKLVREGHADYIAPEPTMATIAKVPVTYTAPTAVENLVYTASNQTLIAAGQTNDGTFEYSLDPTSLDSWKTVLPQAKDAGTYSVYYRVQGDLNHLDSVAATPVAVTIAKAALTATADDKNVIYGDAVPAYTVTYAGWQGNDDASVLTGDLAFACDYAPTSNVGEYTITPSGATATNYTITFVNGKVTVAQAALMITAEDKNVTYGDAVPTYTATYSGWKNTDGASVISGLTYTCEYAPTSNVGEYTIVPSGATATNYAISYTNGKVTVAKAALRITAEDKNVTYGDAVPEYTATYSGWKNTDDASVVSGLVYTCAYAPTSNVGDYTITPSGATATNYEISYTNGKVTVAKADLMITADDKNVIYGDAVPTYTATYSGWKNEDNESVVSNLAYTCEYAPTSNVGEYTITPNGATAQNYTISYTNGKVTVAQATLTVTAEDKSVTYGDAAPAFTATYSGWKNTDDASVVSGLTLTSEYLVTSNVGTYDIVPANATALNYTFVYVNGTLTVNQAALMITADDKSVEYGEVAPEFTASYSGWKNSDDASVVSGLTLTSEYLVTSNVGTYDIVPANATATNYAISFTNGTLTVNQAPLMITADDKSVIYGDEHPEFTASYSGWKNSDDASVVSGLTLTSEYLVTSNVGTYDIVPANASATNYAISYTNGTLTVNQAALTITAEDKEMIYGDEHPEFTASYSGWKNTDDESVVSGLQFSTPYAPGSYIGTYAINPNSATALNYAITFVDGTLTVNKAHVYVSDAEAQIAKFADGHANAVVLEQGVLNGIKLNDPIAHVTTAAFSSADVAENLTITLFYELTGDAALLNNYHLDPTSDIFTNEGVIIEPFIPDNEEKPEDKEATVDEGIEIYAYGYCDGSGYSLKYHLESGNPDQYKIDFADSRFTDVDWTNLEITGKDGTIDIDIPVDMPTGDYTMTVYFRDSRFDWLESRQFNVTFHVNLPETYVRPLFDNVIALVDTCNCLTDIQWYWRANSSEPWQPIEGANGYYYHADGKLTGEYFVSAKMNGEPTYTCGQTDMETLYGDDNKAQAPVVRAYPNPVVNTTIVTIENSDNFEHNLRVVNLMGAEVMSTTFEGNETNVEMSGYPQGNYMISVDGIVVKVMKK